MTFIAIVVGLILGVIGGPVYVLIPWAIAAFLIGWFSDGYRKAAIHSGLFGFVLAFTFMIRGYNGAESLISRLPFFALLGLFGAICAIIWAYIGRFLQAKNSRKQRA